MLIARNLIKFLIRNSEKRCLQSSFATQMEVKDKGKAAAAKIAVDNHVKVDIIIY